MKQSPQTIKVLVIAVIIAGILGSITVLALDSIGLDGAKVLGICMCFIIFGMFGAVSLVVAEKPEYKTLGGAGMLVAGLAFVLSAVAILTGLSDASFLKFIISLFFVSLGLAHICLLHHFNLQNKYASYARMTATIGITLFTFLTIIRVFDSFGGYESFIYSQSVYKITAIAFIVDLAATLLVPLCNRLGVAESVEINFDETPTTDRSEKQDPGV